MKWDGPDQLRLAQEIKWGMRIYIPRRIVEDSFPHYDSPSILEMDFAVRRLVLNQPISEELELKISRKPTDEMLTEFCEERGLSWEYNEREHAYLFRLHSFKEE